jgi:hypothetical protein
MKNLIISLAMVTGFTIASSAQTETSAVKTKHQNNLSPNEKADKQTDKMTEKLGLNPSQSASWEAASNTRNSLNKPLHDKLKGATTPEERKSLRQQMKTNNDNFETTINSFLTAEQKIKYETLKKEQMAKRKK